MSPAFVHQSLHGYSDGHRLISSSFQVGGVDARTMVVMSDLAGPSVRPAEGGYLTGYPLEGVGKYVLARTWSAPEMPRPGCVWTHSLIIDNADLARIASADPLLRLFRRPTPGDRESYSVPLPVREASGRPPKDELQERASSILNAIYAAPRKPILADALIPDTDEQIATQIWMQQWPRLRRSFGFCTLTSVNRSSKNGALDLQFVTEMQRAQRTSAFADAVVDRDVPPRNELSVLVGDLVAAGHSDLREFLRKVGGDVEGGRSAMIPLCELYVSLFDGDIPDLSRAISALDRLGDKGRQQARSVRSLVTRHAVEHVATVEDDVFEFLLNTIEGDSKAGHKQDLDDRFGAAVWQRSPVRFIESIEDGGAIGSAASAVLKNLGTAQLLNGLAKAPEITPTVISRRPELLESVEFWRLPGADEKFVELTQPASAARVAGALLTAGRSDAASEIVARADPGELAMALSAKSADPSAQILWLKALARDPKKVSEVLASGKLAQLSALVSIARDTNPDDVVASISPDPWYTALQGARGSIPQGDEDYLSAFLMARGLGWRSTSPGELIGYSYSRLYKAMAADRLPWESERLATRHLGWRSLFDRTNCPRLRRAVVAKFVDSPLDPELFGRLAGDHKLTKELIDEAANSGRGRRYLNEVRKRLRNAKEKGMRARAEYIETKI